MCSCSRQVCYLGVIICRIALLGLGVGSLYASGPIPFPFTASFESTDGYTVGSLTTDSTWTFSSELTVTVTDTAFDGDQAISFIGSSWLSLQPEGQGTMLGYPVTWVDFYLRPAFAAASELPASISAPSSVATGFVKVGVEGEVYAVDGDGLGGGDWIASGHRVALANDQAVQWMRISYRIDYAQKQWDLYLDGQLVRGDLGFIDQDIASFTRFSLRGEPTTAGLFDYFYAGDINPLFADADNDGLPDSWVNSFGLVGVNAGRYADPDNDGLNNLTEFLLGLNPVNPDTDGDGVHDGREVLHGSSPGVANTVTLGSVPYFDGFEADAPGLFLTGTRAWLVSLGSPQGVAKVVTATTVVAPEGQKSLRLENGTVRLERQFAPVPGLTHIWIDFFADLAPREVTAPAVTPDSAASFYRTADGNLMALDGTGVGGGIWHSVGQPGGGWHRYTLHLNYTTQRWSLWLDGVRHVRDFGFANPVPYFSGLTLEHEPTASAGFDRFAVDSIEPAALDNDGDGLTNAEELALGTDPDLIDTDGDGISDRVEVAFASNPLVVDTFLAHLVNEGQGQYVWRAHFSTVEGYTAGSLDGQRGWRAAGGSTVTGDQTAQLQADSATAPAFIEHLFGNPGFSQPWIAFRARMTAGALPAPATFTGPVSCLFGFSAENTLSIFNATSGQWVNHTVAANASDWNNYALRLDYATRTWMLRVNGVIIAQNLPFRDTGVNMLTRFRMLQDGIDEQTLQSSLDDLIVANVDPATLTTGPGLIDTDGDGMSDAWETLHGLNPANAADATGNPDNDAFTNQQEYAQGHLPNVADTAADYYVNSTLGSDTTFNGRSAYPGTPTAEHGPKATVTAALGSATNGARIIVLPGTGAYSAGTLSSPGKNLTIRPVGSVHIH